MNNWKFDRVVHDSISRIVCGLFYMGMVVLSAAIISHIIGASMHPLLAVLNQLPH